jgi:hypothetical protein
MSKIVRNRWKGVVYYKSGGVGPKLLIWGCLAVLLFSMLGCSYYEGPYVGKVFEPPANNVVIFDFKGDNGVELTKMIGTDFTHDGIKVIYGSQSGDPGTNLGRAKIARDNQAQAFVLGEVVESGFLHKTQFHINAHFSIHEVEEGYQVGGIQNAYFQEETDLFYFLSQIFNKDIDKQIEAKRPQLLQKFAQKVSFQLSCNGFGHGTGNHHDTGGHEGEHEGER